MVAGSIWKVVGGAETGGIIVRDGKELSSGARPCRLSTGSLIKEQILIGGRLHYIKLKGLGPESGWVSVSTKQKPLLTPSFAHREIEELDGTSETRIDTPLNAPAWTGPLSDNEWRERLSADEYEILRNGNTDPWGAHAYINLFPQNGHFACAGCGLALYSCRAKFRDVGWPAWDKCFHSKEIGCHVGARGGGGVFEIHCMRCKGHLGHVFFGERHTEANERH